MKVEVVHRMYNRICDNSIKEKNVVCPILLYRESVRGIYQNKV